MKTSLLVMGVAVLAVAVSALGQSQNAGAAQSSSSSEFYHQPSAGVGELTAGLLYTTLKQDIDTSPSASMSGGIVVATYEYGLNDQVSLGVGTGYTSETVKVSGSSDKKVSGMDDVTFGVQSFSPAGPGTFRYGANLDFSPGDQTVASNGDTNAFSGGLTLTPYLGFQMPVTDGFWGGKFSYDMNLGKKTVSYPSFTDKYSGGETGTLSLYYEAIVEQTNHLGFEAQYITINDSTYDVQGKSEAISPDYLFGVYGSFVAGTGVLVPELDYLTTGDNKYAGNKINADNQWTVKASYRIPFN